MGNEYRGVTIQKSGKKIVLKSEYHPLLGQNHLTNIDQLLVLQLKLFTQILSKLEKNSNVAEEKNHYP